MASFTVRKGKRYQATVKLKFFQRVASNERVASEFRKVGFTDVTAAGSGGTRRVKGTWSLEDKSGGIPAQVTSIKEVSVIEA